MPGTARAGPGPGGELQGGCRSGTAWGETPGGWEPPGRHLRCSPARKRGAGIDPAPKSCAPAVNRRAGRDSLTGSPNRWSARAFRPGPWQGAGMMHHSGPRKSSGCLRLSTGGNRRRGVHPHVEQPPCGATRHLAVLDPGNRRAIDADQFGKLALRYLPFQSEHLDDPIIRHDGYMCITHTAPSRRNAHVFCANCTHDDQ